MLAETLGLNRSSLMNREQKQRVIKKLKETLNNPDLSIEAIFNLYKRCTYSRARQIIAEKLELKIENLSEDKLLILSMNPPTRNLGLKFFEALKGREYAPIKYIEQVAAWSKCKAVKDAATMYLQSLETCSS